MTESRNDKIKNLHTIWPKHVVLPTLWLVEQGYFYNLLNQYKKSNWISSIGRGAYKLAHDSVGWKGAVFGLQKQYGDTIHLGGLSALELQGSSHFVRMSPKVDVYLYSNSIEHLPSWTKSEEWSQASLKLIHTNFLNTKLGIETFTEGDFSLNISSRERAMLEMLYSVNTLYSLVDCNLIMENLNTLRPNLVQSLLNNCHSIKATRLFLFLAKRNSHKWFAELDLSCINQGSGDRQITKNGTYDAEFKITYPRELFVDDRTEF